MIYTKIPTEERKKRVEAVLEKMKMLKDTCRILDSQGFKESRHGIKDHYVIEGAFVRT